MKSFLRQVVEIYVDREGDNIEDFCFVFPNKRSGLFFTKYLKEIGAKLFMLPAVTTISDFISDISGSVEASRLEQLMVLYTAYRAVLNERHRDKDAIEFDRFQYWGDMILNDFNDVDRYLVDPYQLFTNLDALKSISSNFLTPEQLKVIKEYWGDLDEDVNVDDFWKHVAKGSNSDVSDKFIKLWEILYDIYLKFGERLSRQGLTYSGKAYRSAVDRLKEMDREDMPYKRYIFVGFNVLSTSETRIFEILQSRGMADFYWDFASPAFDHPANKAVRFLRRYVNNFKSLYPLAEPRVSDFGQIILEGIPSNIGQAKAAGSILSELAQKRSVGLETAVVLPDEELFIPILHSVPEEIKHVNVTMGMPLRHSSVATLMGNIVIMQSAARTLHGEITYYYQHVLSVLSHPMLRSLRPKECAEIVEYINRDRIYNLSAAYACEKWPDLQVIFASVKNPDNPEDVFEYSEALMSWLERGLSRDKVQGKSSEHQHPIELGFIRRYHQGVSTLRDLARRYRIHMNDSTFFHLMDKLMATESINFSGEPLKGLQIMGVLETRSLDFDNLVILSMNERVFPRKHYAPTFIPNTLRRGYGMATLEFQESVYSYYFYRLITRAKRAYLLYDTRSTGIKSGEMSRYLHQLKRLFPESGLRHIVRSYKALSFDGRNVTVEKTPEILERLHRYRDPQSGKNLSPSAIDHYIRCPLQFYLEHVEGYYVEDELKEYMDEGTYGTIVHEVADKLLEGFRRSGETEVYISRERMKEIIDDRVRVEREITRSVNRNYLRLDEHSLDRPLQGENKLLGMMMARYIELLFERESEIGPYYFIDGEMELKHHLKINDDLSINLRAIIDRVDRMPDGSIRLVDYKTGGDSIEAKNWDQLFATGNIYHQKCFVQLLLYCNIYAQATGYQGQIQPIVYRFRRLAVEPLLPLRMGKDDILDYRPFNEVYLNGLGDKLSELFDPAIPFYPTPDENACKYCKFTAICDRAK